MLRRVDVLTAVSASVVVASVCASAGAASALPASAAVAPRNSLRLSMGDFRSLIQTLLKPIGGWCIIWPQSRSRNSKPRHIGNSWLVAFEQGNTSL
jgi:hypothetical protein